MLSRTAPTRDAMSSCYGWRAIAAGQRRAFLPTNKLHEAGGYIRKGEHGTRVYFVKQLQIKDREGEDADTHLVPMLREYTVFNVAQCDNLPDSIKAGRPMRVRNPDTRDGLADEFLRSTGADIREGHGEAYFVPSQDFISVPAFEAFKGADHFYSVAFHELSHWTGHKSRLDRDLKNRFGSREYAAEELIAELGAAFLCAEFGFNRLQASSRERRPPRTAATTSALRRMTQRFVPGVGKSAIVNGLPSGPITYWVLGRRGSITNHLMHLTEQLRSMLRAAP